MSARTAIGAHLAHRARLDTFPSPFPACAWGNDPRALAQQLGQQFEPLPAAELCQRIAASSVEHVALGPAASSTFPLSPGDCAFFARLLLTDPHYAAVAADGDVVVLRRGADPARGRQTLAHALAAGRS